MARFFDLPAELRNDIYHLVLVMTRPQSIVNWHDDCARRRRALTQVCRQLRKESMPVYFGNNTFLYIRDVTRKTEVANCIRLPFSSWSESLDHVATKYLRRLIFHTEHTRNGHCRCCYVRYVIDIGAGSVEASEKNCGFKHQEKALEKAKAILAVIHRIDGKPLVTANVVMCLYDACS